jgi:hypothetical protein
MWASNIMNALSTPPKLPGLPPTNDALAENVKTVHYQAILWRSIETHDSPKIGPELYGWVKDTTLKLQRPFTLPTGIPLVSEFHSATHLV